MIAGGAGLKSRLQKVKTRKLQLAGTGERLMISNSYNCHNARLPVPARKNLLFAGDSLNEQNFSDKILRYKMAIIYIHIGTHKTGSTAIQETLRINKKLLKKNNCMLLRIKGLCDRILKMDSFDINRLDIEKNNVKRTIKKAKCDNIILSCENLSGNVMNAYMDNELIARSLKYIFSDYQVKIIVYLRRQDFFIESLYTQLIHEGNSWSFNEFKKKIAIRSFDWFAFLTRFAIFFEKSNLIVRPYEKIQLRDGDVVKDFFHLLDIDMDARFKCPKKLNHDYNREALKIARICNTFLDKNKKVRLRNLLQVTNYMQPFGHYSFFSKEERKALLTHYHSTNAMVAKEYLNRDNGKLFYNVAPGEDKDQQDNENVSVDELVKVMMNILIYNDSLNDFYTIRWLRKLEKYLLNLVRKIKC